MSCPDENQLLGFHRGALTADGARAIETHLDGCSACRETLIYLVRLAPPSAERLHAEEPTGEYAALVPMRGSKIGRYVVIRKIGAGGMGVVYAAYDPELDRRVALKVLNREHSVGPEADERRLRLLREAQAMAKLSHPNVITVHDVGTVDGQVFVAMELAEGGTLAAWLHAKPRSVEDIVHVFLLAGRGLAAAHAAGIIHRDFKPDNLLVGDDGRVRVVDFGLARSLAAPLDAAATAPSPTSAQAGGASLLAGTPAYMAPEQHDANRSDARSDQFSFCVALWEALYGMRPEPEPAAVSRSLRGVVPARVAAAIVRGLSRDPARRFETMAQLLVQLAPASSSRTRRLLMGAALALSVAAALAGWARAITTRRTAQCRSAEAQLAAVWNPERKQRMRDRFLTTNVPYAAFAFDQASALLDAFGTRWTRMHTDACEATHVRGEQSSALLDLRMSCLKDALRHFRANSDLLVEADQGIVDHASALTSTLPSLDACADARALQRESRPQLTPEQRDAIDRVEEVVANADAFERAGKFAEGMKVLAPALAEAKALGPRTLAHALLVQSNLQDFHGDDEDAERSAFEAASAAERAGDEVTLVKARVSLAWAMRQQRHLPDALRWCDLAQAALERLGTDEFLESRVLEVHSMVLDDIGRFAEARAEGERTLALVLRTLAPGRREISSAYLNLGVVAHDQGKLDEALDFYQRAYETSVRGLGPTHPHNSQSMINIGSTLADAERYAEARVWFQRALELRRDVLHIEDRQIGAIFLNLGFIDRLTGQLEAASANERESLRIMEKVLGPQHPWIGWPLSELGRVLVEQKQYPQAIATLERALALPPRKNAAKAEIKFPLGRALWESGIDPARGELMIGQAEASYDEHHVVDAKQLAEIHAWRSKSHARTAQR